MPKDSTATREVILGAALSLLRSDGIDGFSIERVARLAGVAKGLVNYHYGSRARLLVAAGRALRHERGRRFARARAAEGGIRGIDAGWRELLEQERDGTARAWIGLTAAGSLEAPAQSPELETAAVDAVLDGCALALAAGVPTDAVREAHDVLWLALLRVLESA